MECKLEVVCLDKGILTFQLLHSIYYFLNSYNCYQNAYNIKYYPDYAAPIINWNISIVLPFLKLRYVFISWKCDYQNAPEGNHK